MRAENAPPGRSGGPGSPTRDPLCPGCGLRRPRVDGKCSACGSTRPPSEPSDVSVACGSVMHGTVERPGAMSCCRAEWIVSPVADRANGSISSTLTAFAAADRPIVGAPDFGASVLALALGELRFGSSRSSPLAAWWPSEGRSAHSGRLRAAYARPRPRATSASPSPPSPLLTTTTSP
jgi:hypothetical protein